MRPAPALGSSTDTFSPLRTPRLRKRPSETTIVTRDTHPRMETVAVAQTTAHPTSAAAPAQAKRLTRLTRQGWLFLWGSVLLYVASLTSQSSLLLLLNGIFCGCYLINWRAARNTIASVDLAPPESESFAEGGSATQSWRISNRSNQPLGPIEVQRDDSSEPLLKISGVSPNHTGSAVPSYSLVRRGVYPHAQLQVRSSHPFGLIEARRSLTVRGEVTVYPAIYPTDSPPASGFEPMVGGRFKGRRRSPSGSEFAGIRPFNPGDPLRQIDWKSSSKGHGLMVKMFEEELSGRIGLILGSEGAPGSTAYDDAVRAAGSLIFAALDDGHHVEWISLDNPDLASVIPPFTDGEQILHSLARLQPNGQSTSAQILELAVSKLSSKAAVCLVLNEINAEVTQVISHLKQQHRRVSVYLPVGATTLLLPQDVPVFHYSNREIQRST